MTQVEAGLPLTAEERERIQRRELENAATTLLRKSGCKRNGQPRARAVPAPSEAQLARDKRGIMLLIETSRLNFRQVVEVTGHLPVT